MTKKVISSFLNVLIGLVFIFSALSKIPSLEQFGWTIVETTFLNWTFAEWFARILIGLELWLGLLFILHWSIKKVAIPLSVSVLVIFTLYLVQVISSQGNSGNCGCFGEVVAMTPLQSIYKNIGLLVLIGLLYFTYREWTFKYQSFVMMFILLACISAPIAFNPPESIYVYDKEPDLNKPIPLSILYQSSKNKPPNIEVRKGKHIVTFLSLTCSYCRKAAKRMRIMKDKHPELPFYAIINGDSSNLDDFFKDTRMTNIDFTLFNGPEEFSTMNDGFSLPTIKWVQDTTLIRESNYLTLNENDLLEWLKK